VTKGAKIVFFKHEPVPENVIEMAMSIQEQNRLKFLFFDKTGQLGKFFSVITSAINYGAIA
jgi:hypothetical protein